VPGEEDIMMIDADRPLQFPPTARISYEHGDTTIALEVPLEHVELLVVAWRDVVQNLFWPR
jgi:hypothetical protein